MSPHANGIRYLSYWLPVEKLEGKGGVNSWSKVWLKQVAARKMLYLAHGADASKADCTWATQLTADQQQEVALLVVNCINWN